MKKFQGKLKDYENKMINNDDILELIKDYNQEDDNLFLIQEFKNNYQINQYYTRSLYEIIESLIERNDFSDKNNFCDFLEKQLYNVDTLSSLNRDIFIKIYLKLTKNTENVKKLYDEYISKKYINVSTIEDFNEYFLNNDEENLYLIKSFLYDKEGWFRLHYYDYKSGIKKESQDKILDFSKENLELFFDEINKKENIGNLLHELYEDKENNFIQKLIDKAINSNLENKIYEFLISQIRFAGNLHDYYSKNAFFNRNIKLFNLLKNKGTLNYQQFFKDINYKEPGYYYYSEFEQFIFQTIETSEDLKSIAKLEELEEKEYFLRNGYFYVTFSLNDLEKSKLFKEAFPEQIKIFEEQRKKSIDANQKYQDENDKEILDEIKEKLENAKDTEHKLFVPKFLEDFINKFDYQLRVENETVIHEIVKNQLNYFFTWKNLDITTPDILSKFQKTKTGYHAPSFMHDGTFGVVFKSALKVGFDLSEYKNRLSCFYPFQGNGEIGAELKKYFGFDEIKQIIDIYKKYPDIRGFQSYNIIYLFQKKYERDGIQLNNFFQDVRKNDSLKSDLIYILKELNKDENFNKYYLKESLVLLYELGVEKSYFQSLEGTQPSKNYFKDILQPEVRDDEFKKYLTINEFLIKNQDKKAFLWRLEQLLNGFIDIPNYEFENGIARIIGDLEDEIDRHYFIKILGEYKYIDENIEQKVIELIEKSFNEYDNFENYCKYIWKAMEYYLKTLSKDLEYNEILIDKITELLSKSTDANKNIAFKVILGNISDKFLSKVEKEEDVNKRVKKFISNNIEIYTEGKTDWKHLVRSWYELEKQGKLEKNNINKNIIDYLVKYEANIGGGNEIYKFTKIYSQINKNKLIIGIFDTDGDTKELKIDEKNNCNYSKIFENYYQQFLFVPKELNDEEFFKNNGICIEFYYDDEILDIYNFYRLNKFERTEKFSKSIRKISDKLYLNGEKKALIIDKNTETGQFFCNLGNKIDIKDITKSIFSKNQFAEDIAHDYLKDRKEQARHNSFFKEPNINTWDRFLPIFISLTKIIEEWHNKDKENISDKEVMPKNIEEKVHNQTFFQKIYSKLKSIFKQKN